MLTNSKSTPASIFNPSFSIRFSITNGRPIIIGRASFNSLISETANSARSSSPSQITMRIGRNLAALTIGRIIMLER